MPKEIINVTDITTYLYCPRLLYIRKIKKIPTPLTKEMVVGRLKHNILESFSKNEQTIIEKIDKDYDKIDLSLFYN